MKHQSPNQAFGPILGGTTLDYYPAVLDLRGRNCLVVGGGTVAERKVESLLECGARVKVVTR